MKSVLLSIIQIIISISYAQLSLFVRNGNNYNQAPLEITVSTDASINDVKNIIAKQMRLSQILFEQMTVSFGGVILDNSALLSDSGVCMESELTYNIPFYSLQVDVTVPFTTFNRIVNIDCIIPVDSTDFFGILRRQIVDNIDELNDTIPMVFRINKKRSRYQRQSDTIIPKYVLETSGKLSQLVKLDDNRYGDTQFQCYGFMVVMFHSDYNSITGPATLDSLLQTEVNGNPIDICLTPNDYTDIHVTVDMTIGEEYSLRFLHQFTHRRLLV